MNIENPLITSSSSKDLFSCFALVHGVISGWGHQGYSILSPCSLLAVFRLKSFNSQPTEASLAVVSPVRCVRGTFLGLGRCKFGLTGLSEIGRSIEFTEGSIIGTVATCRSRVMAVLIEYMLPFGEVGEVGGIGEVGPRPSRAAIPSVADCDRGL